MKHSLVATIQPNDIVTLSIAGDLTQERLPALEGDIETAKKVIEDAAKEKDKINILFDMTEFTGMYDAKAIEMMTDFAKHNAQYTEKSAGFGGSDKNALAAEAVAAMAERENIRIFPTKEQALHGWRNNINIHNSNAQYPLSLPPSRPLSRKVTARQCKVSEGQRKLLRD